MPARINIDNVDLATIEIVERGGNPTNDPRIGSAKTITGIVFHDSHGATVTLWSEGDLRALLMRGLSRLEAYYSQGASGMPKKR